MALARGAWRAAAAALGAGAGGAAALLATRDETTCEAERRPRPGTVETDYLVIGAGSAGCAVAARLSRALPQCRTLLVEAGDTDDVDEIQNAVDYFGKAEKVFGSDRDWSYHAEAQPELAGRALYWPRGKVVGGCSSFNTMVYLRGDPSDYDRWREVLGDEFADWDARGMAPFFKRAESHPGDARVHGKDGPMTVAPLDHASHHPEGAAHRVTKAFVAAGEQVGERANTDFALNGNMGVGVNDVNARGGRRCNAAAYLKMVGAYPGRELSAASDNGGALHVWLCARVQKILFDAGKRACGVQLRLEPRADTEDAADPGSRAWHGDAVSPGTDGLVNVRVRREVILCCGAIDSPRLLLLSGVGPARELEAVGVDVVADLPGVGAKLKDHLHVPLCYRIPEGVRPHSHSNICEGTLFTRLDPASPSSDLQVHCGTLFFEPDGFSPLGEGFTLTPSLIHPRSVGSLRLVSASPDERPAITANYLEDPRDLQTLVEGVKFVRGLGREMLTILGAGEEHFPGADVRSDAQIEDYVRRFAGSMYHPCCSARMGRSDDPLAVLDASLAVRGGVTGLRVMDASSFPEIIGANTNATCIALGEKGAQILVDEAIIQGKYDAPPQ